MLRRVLLTASDVFQNGPDGAGPYHGCGARAPLRRGRFLTFLWLVVTMASPLLAHAAEVFEVTIDTPVDPMTVTGVVISSSGMEERTDASFRRLNPKTIVVSFPYDSGDADQTTMGTAMMRAADGEIIFGEVRPIRADNSLSLLANLPECTEEIKVPALIEAQLANLQKLVEIRTARRSIYEGKLKSILTDKYVERLTRLERGLGLDARTPLTPDLPPLELVDRLSRLKTALQNFDKHKEKK